MSTTARPAQPQTPATQSPKEQFLASFQREHATTLRVLRAYPAGKLDLRPAAKCKTARELAWVFVIEQAMAEQALTTGFDFENTHPSAGPEAPATMDAIVEAFEQGAERVAGLVRGMGDDQFSETVRFFVKPKTLGDVPKRDFLWMLLSDQIHHRGQFSIYLRMADGNVPSIYGPTADEPWM